MHILIELSIIAAFVLLAIYLTRRPIAADAEMPDDVAALNERVRTLEQIIIDQDRDLRNQIDGLS